MGPEGQEKPLRAVVAAVQLTGISDIEFHSSLNELRELATTLGFELVGTFTQKRDHFDTTAYMGIGKRQEMRRFVENEPEPEEGTEEPAASGNAQRTANRAALRELIVQAFAGLTLAQVTERLEQAQIASARVNDMAGLWSHPQLAARSRWREVASPAGPLPALLPPGSWADGDPVLNPIPALGQHTNAILAELGVDAAEIAALRAAEAI